MSFIRQLNLKRRVRRKLKKSATSGETEIQLLPFLVSGGLAIDVGANKGLYTYFLSKLADRVEAYEPNPVLAAKLSACNLPNTNVHAKAVSTKPGEAVLNIPLSPKGKHRANVASLNSVDGDADKIKVPVAAIDAEGFSDVRFIKIDVEGHELAVLQGAEETITRDRPIILLEINDGVDSPDGQAVIGFMLARGYTALQHFEGTLRHYSNLDGQRLHVDRNYIFIPKKV